MRSPVARQPGVTRPGRSPGSGECCNTYDDRCRKDHGRVGRTHDVNCTGSERTCTDDSARFAQGVLGPASPAGTFDVKEPHASVARRDPAAAVRCSRNGVRPLWDRRRQRGGHLSRSGAHSGHAEFQLRRQSRTRAGDDRGPRRSQPGRDCRIIDLASSPVEYLQLLESPERRRDGPLGTEPVLHMEFMLSAVRNAENRPRLTEPIGVARGDRIDRAARPRAGMRRSASRQRFAPSSEA